MRHFRTIDEVTEEYLHDHPDEVDDFVTLIFEEYAQDGDLATLLSCLRVICQYKGVTFVAESTGMTRKGVQKATSEKGNPHFESINMIMHALGYDLIPWKRKPQS